MTTRKSASDSITVEMSLAKETKGTFVFQADEDGAVVTSLYVRKEGFPNGAPDSITLMISV